MPAQAVHLVHFYSSPEGLAASLCSFFAEPLLNGESLIVAMRPEHQAALEEALVRAGVDLRAEIRAGRYLALDLAETLDSIMTPDGVSPELFRAGPRALVLQARHRTGAVTVYGEAIGALVARGDVVAAFELEDLWSKFVQEHPFRLFCGYPRDLLNGDLAGMLDDVTSTHDALVAVRAPAEPGLTVTMELPLGADTAARARGALREVLGAWGIGGRQLADDATAVVSELVAAASRRGATRITLSMTGEREHVLVTVGGTGPGHGDDQWRGVEGHAEAGRSYAVIGALAQSWGVDKVPEGSRVWARLAR